MSSRNLLNPIGRLFYTNKGYIDVLFLAATTLFLSMASARGEEKSLHRTGGEIIYRITPEGDHLTLEMEIPVSQPTVSLQMPSWAPGRYSLQNPWATLSNVSAFDERNVPLPVVHSREGTWTINALGRKALKVRYERPLTKAQFDSDQKASEPNTVHYGSEPVYFLVTGKEREPCLLEFIVPQDTKIAIGLRPVQPLDGHPTFVARSFAELVDNPVTMGDFEERHYEVDTTKFTEAFRGPGKDWVDKQRVMQMGQFVSQVESDFFGGLPFDRYVWHFWVFEGSPLAGGTEHANSAEMHLSTELGRYALQGLAHESFHAWNVKRIRPKALAEPFDYTRLPKTGALWWLEGVTDYYSQLLPLRYGAWGRDFFLQNALIQVGSVRSNPARFEISPYDSSYRLSEPGGSSTGFKVNYYPTGWVLGMLFDLELRSNSNGRFSLDDVMRALWARCKNGQPGFEEGAIREEFVRLGGSGLGILYDHWVLQPGELPIEGELAKVGLRIASNTDHKGNSGSVIVKQPEATLQQTILLEDWLRSNVHKGITPPLIAYRYPIRVPNDPKSYDQYEGRYELTHYVMLNVNSHNGQLLASLDDNEGAELIPVGTGQFFHSQRNAEISFTRDSSNEVTGILWSENGKERKIAKIGPFIRALKTSPDPSPAGTASLLNTLKTLGKGADLGASASGLAPGAVIDFAASGPIHGLAAIRSLHYIAAEQVAGRNISRHAGEVDRIVYYIMTTDKKSRYLMVYLTSNGLLTDFDYVDD